MGKWLFFLSGSRIYGFIINLHILFVKYKQYSPVETHRPDCKFCAIQRLVHRSAGPGEPGLCHSFPRVIGQYTADSKDPVTQIDTSEK